MTTDRLTDSLDRQWVPGTLLGRGTWGRSRIILASAPGVPRESVREAVLKVPLTEADFPADVPLPEDLLAACRACAREQAELLAGAGHPWLPRLDATVDLGNGRTGLVMPHYTTLEHRLRTPAGIQGGIDLGEVLKLVHRIATMLAESGTVHGNLRPSNILFGERGEPFLADPATPAVVAHHARLVGTADIGDWLPPEARTRAAPINPRLPGRPTSAIWARWDTWALCQIVHCAILSDPHDDGGPMSLQLAAGGLDKVALSSLKDAAHAKLGAEGSNPRFRSRVTDRLGALLSRGLSAEFEPSPPYRFATARDLADRVNEILALLRPRVVEVGRILLPSQAADGVFQHGADVSFTVTVGCTLGITDHEDLVCGLQLVDLDAKDDARKPVEDAKLAVQVHPSGRLRFQLTLPDVAPGRYRVRVAFAVKDSGDEPQVANGDFQVRPAPGYVPPRQAPAPAAPLAFRPQAAGAGRSATPPPVLRPAGVTGAGVTGTGVTGVGPADPRTTPPAGTARRSDPGSAAGPESRVGEGRTPPPATHPPPANRPPPADRASVSGDRRTPSFAAERTNEVVGLFPRPVAPPDEEDERFPVPIPAPKTGTPASAPSRATPISMRVEEPMTDATMPAPNNWPPTNWPPGNWPPPPPSGLRALPSSYEDRPGEPARNDAASESHRPGGFGPSERLDTEELLEDTADQWPAGGGEEHQTGPRGVPVESTRSTPHGVRDPIRPEFDLPSGGEDLPGFGTSIGGRSGSPLHPQRSRRLPGALERIIDLVRRDSYVAVGAAVAACLVIVLLSSAMLRACE